MKTKVKLYSNRCFVSLVLFTLFPAVLLLFVVYGSAWAAEYSFVTYVNDGFTLTLPSNATLSSHVEKKSVDPFSISGGSEVPTEKIYEINLATYERLTILLNIFENNGYRVNENNRVTVRNADSAYLRKSVSDSILERSTYELFVLRGNLIYILETTYHPDYALMGQARGQTDFSYEREHIRELLSIFDTMINSFALTDNPVDFATITSGGTLWQENVINLIMDSIQGDHDPGEDYGPMRIWEDWSEEDEKEALASYTAKDSNGKTINEGDTVRINFMFDYVEGVVVDIDGNRVQVYWINSSVVGYSSGHAIYSGVHRLGAEQWHDASELIVQ